MRAQCSPLFWWWEVHPPKTKRRNRVSKVKQGFCPVKKWCSSQWNMDVFAVPMGKHGKWPWQPSKRQGKHGKTWKTWINMEKHGKHGKTWIISWGKLGSFAGAEGGFAPCAPQPPPPESNGFPLDSFISLNLRPRPWTLLAISRIPESSEKIAPEMRSIAYLITL